MAARNAREPGSFGVTPQTFGAATSDKFNRETASQIEELQAKLKAVVVKDPEEDETPADTPLFAYRFGTFGWPFTTAVISLSSGQPDVEVPGSGFGIGPVYKGEHVELEFLIDNVTVVGGAYFRIQLIGRSGQGSGEAVVAEGNPWVQSPLTARPVYAGSASLVAPRRLYEARVRILAGSGGGTMAVPNQSSMLQRLSIYSPIRRPDDG